MKENKPETTNFLKQIVPFFAAIIFALLILLALNKFTQQPQEDYTYKIFVSATCPHCRIVKEYVNENNLEEKLDLGFLETSNPANASELLYYCDKIGKPAEECGIPLMYDSSEDEVVPGDTPIIDYLDKISQ